MNKKILRGTLLWAIGILAPTAGLLIAFGPDRKASNQDAAPVLAALGICMVFSCLMGVLSGRIFMSRNESPRRWT